MITAETIKTEGSFTKDLGFCQQWNLKVNEQPTNVFTFERNGQLHWSDHAPRHNWRYFKDDDGREWCWNTQQVFSIEESIEIEQAGAEEKAKGYPAESYEKVVAIMTEKGFFKE